MRAGAEVAACTIVSKNYLSLARTLARSYREQVPGSRFFVLLVDRVDGYFDLAGEPFEVVTIESLPIPDFQRFCFQYNLVELNTAAKPYFLTHLLDRYGFRKLIYFDPDILILQGIESLWELLDRSSIVLVPHLTSPYDDDHTPTELDILQAGAFNLGFIGIADTPTTRRMLAWWSARLYDKCRMEPGRGMHVDQHWMDLVPGFYEGVEVVRDPVYNVAYWNLNDRTITVREGEVRVNGRPCVFFHFSGFDPTHMGQVSKHQTRFTMEGIGEAADLFRRYRDLLFANGYRETRAWPYAYDTFSNGVPIPEIARAMYRALGDEARKFGDAFHVDHVPSFFDWLCAGVDGERDPARVVPRLWYEVYHQRPDLQAAFPAVLGQDRAAFLAWISPHGAAEARIDPRFISRKPRAVAPGHRSRASRVMRLYRTVVQPMEPVLTPALKRVLGRHRWLWSRLKRVRDRIRFAGPLPALPPSRREVGMAEQAMLPVQEFGVNVAGYFSSEKGVGEAGRASVRALEAAGVPHVLNNVVDTGSANAEAKDRRFSTDNPYSVNLIHVNADQVPGFASRGNGAYLGARLNIGFWFWELSRFPDEWQSSFDVLDEVWVATNFALDAVSRVSPIPVVKMPLGLAPEPAISDRVDRAFFGLPRDAFVFLFIFDSQSALERKNPFALVDAFKRAFGDREDVVLALKSADARDLELGFPVAAIGAGAKNIKTIDSVLPRDEVNALLNMADCYVSLHRSEGFGLPIAEAMMLGKPVIVTGYSGNMDFTTPANSLLVKYRLVEIERHHGPYKKGCVWADPDVEHAAQLMRWVYEHRDEARAMGRCAQEDLARLYHPRVAGALIKERLLRLTAGTRPPGG